MRNTPPLRDRLNALPRELHNPTLVVHLREPALDEQANSRAHRIAISSGYAAPKFAHRHCIARDAGATAQPATDQGGHTLNLGGLGVRKHLATLRTYRHVPSIYLCTSRVNVHPTEKGRNP
jgi:hypothetical protein